MKKLLSLKLNPSKDEIDPLSSSYFESSDHDDNMKTPLNRQTPTDKEKYFYSDNSDDDVINASQEIVEKTLDNSFGRVQ